MPSSNVSTAALAPTASPASLSFVAGFTALVAAALAMSLSPSLVKLADVGPFASAFWRVALALPVLWPWMRHAEAAHPVSFSDGSAGHRSQQGWRGSLGVSPATLLAGLAFAGDLFFWHLSITRTSVANATFFATTAPIWVVVFGWLVLRKRVGWPVLYGLVLCIAGGAALVAQSFAFNPDRMVGDGLGVVTGIFFGLYFLAVRAARDRTGAARVTFQLSVISALLLMIVALGFDAHVMPRSPKGWGILIALALVCHAGGQGLLSVALGRLPAVFSSLVIFLEAIAAALIAWALLGEPVTLVQAAGGLVIIAGIWIARPRNDDTTAA